MSGLVPHPWDGVAGAQTAEEAADRLHDDIAEMEDDIEMEDDLSEAEERRELIVRELLALGVEA